MKIPAEQSGIHGNAGCFRGDGTLRLDRQFIHLAQHFGSYLESETMHPRILNLELAKAVFIQIESKNLSESRAGHEGIPFDVEQEFALITDDLKRDDRVGPSRPTACIIRMGPIAEE